VKQEFAGKIVLRFGSAAMEMNGFRVLPITMNGRMIEGFIEG
jgi:hypothetical protein